MSNSGPRDGPEFSGETKSLGEPKREGGNDAVRQCRELMGRVGQRLTLDNPRLIERYAEAKLHLLVHFRIVGIDEEFVACLQKDVGGSEEGAHRGEVGGVWKRLLHHRGHVCAEVETLEHRPNSNQQEVFFGVVKSAENPKLIIPSFVWFEQADRIGRYLRRTLYFSALFGFEFRGAVSGVEIDPFRVWRVVPRAATNNLIGEAVDGAYQIWNDAACDRRRAAGGGFNAREVINQLARLRIALGSDFIRCGFEESPNFPIQLSDVLFGPFDF